MFRSYSKKYKRFPGSIYLFFWRYPVISLIISFIKGITVGFFICTFMGCAGKWQVVQQLDVNMYHLQNLKTKEIKIVISQDDLNDGQILKKKNISIIVEIEK